MKPSRYNFFFDAEDGTHLAFNALSGGFATLTEKEYHQIQRILAMPNTYRFNSKAKRELRDQLIMSNFIVQDGVDELDILKVRYRSSRFDRGQLKLTILPTLRCNFRCVYCFETRKNATMRQETQKALVEFVKRKTEKVEGLAINWYGGEPLLTLDIIAQLEEEFRKICDVNGCRFYPGGIVTNGYLLNRKVGERLREMGIEMAQVTLDGPRDVHDQRRPLAGGKGTFDRIMENLCQVADILKMITIRVNTDKTNADRVIEVLDAIEERDLKGKVSVYFGEVKPYTKVCANIAENCLMDQEYGELEVQLARQCLERGFQLARYPRPKAHYCVADQVNSYVVGPTGYLYKCWFEPGNMDEAVGHVGDQKRYEEKKGNSVKWLAWDVFEREECRECDLLPICMGGCPYEGQRLNMHTRGACDSWRYNLLDMLKLYYTSHFCISGKMDLAVDSSEERR